MKKWQIQEAKAKLSSVVKNAVKNGPQQITVRGKSTAVVMSTKQYLDLTSPKSSFTKFMASSPLHGVDLKMERDKSNCRKIKL